MKNQEEIYRFAMKYLRLYTNPKTTELDVFEGFSEQCFAFGFEMDCGNRFIERFGTNAFYEIDGLEQIIGDVDEISLITSAIFSHWRYVTHWSYCEHLLDENHRTWMATAFERLAEMTRPPELVEEESRQIYNASPLFEGKLWKFQLSSPNTGYCAAPYRPDSEVEQQLTITADGRIKLLRYQFGTASVHHELFEKQNYRIAPERAAKIMEAVSGYFKKEHRTDFVTDISPWQLTLTNDEGKRYKAFGPLCYDLPTPSGGLSDLIRAELGRSDLLVFDGLPDVIQHVEIQYCRYAEDENSLFEEQETTEKSEVLADREFLILDGTSGTLDYRRETSSGFKENKTWKASQWVMEILEDLVWIAESLDEEGEIMNDLDTMNESSFSKRKEKLRRADALSFPKYSVRITARHHGRLKQITSSFDQNELPEVWLDFIEKIEDFTASFRTGEIFGASRKKKGSSEQDHFIFCNVVFGHGKRTYSYLADQDDFALEDQVIVPAGADNHEAIATIRSIQTYSKEEAPYPIEKMKHILRKYRDEASDRKIN